MKREKEGEASMREVIQEYGSAAIAIAGTALLLIALQISFFSGDSLFGRLIELWCNATC